MCLITWDQDAMKGHDVRNQRVSNHDKNNEGN